MNDCFFSDVTGGCRVLTVKKCPKNCRFRKTEAEYYRDIKRAEQLLMSKNLRSVVKDEIVTVEKIGDTE